MRAKHLVPVLPVALLVVHAVYLWGYTTDDAGISFTYARNLVQGHGLVLNPGDPPVEAYSNPLWTFLLAGAIALGLGPVGASKVLGLLFAGATLFAMPFLAKQLFGHRTPVLRLFAPMALALSTPYVLWTVGGLENALMGFLLLAGLWRAGVEMVSNAVPLSGLLFFLLAITRPEGAMYFLLPALLRLAAAWRQGMWRDLAVWVSGFFLPMSIYHVWHYLYFHEVVPNTYYAKGRNIGWDQVLTWGSQGWDYVLGWMRDYRAWPLASALLTLLNRSTVLAGTLLVGSSLAGLLGVIYVGGDWMQEYRFISPLLPVLYLGCQEGILQAGDWLSRLTPARLARLISFVALSALLVAWAEPSLARSPQVLEHPLVPLAKVKDRALYFRKLAEEADVVSYATYADVDLGGTSYFSGLRMIDLGGLADPVIGRARYDHKRIRQYVFEVRRPAFIHVHGVWLGRLGLLDGPEIERDYLLLDYYVDSEGRNYNFVRRDLLVAADAPRRPWRLTNDEVEITGYDLESSGDAAVVTLYWRALRQPTRDYWLSWTLELDGSQVGAGSRKALYGWLPASNWRLGETYREKLRLNPWSGQAWLRISIVGKETVTGIIQIP